MAPASHITEYDLTRQGGMADQIKDHVTKTPDLNCNVVLLPQGRTLRITVWKENMGLASSISWDVDVLGRSAVSAQLEIAEVMKEVDKVDFAAVATANNRISGVDTRTPFAWDDATLDHPTWRDDLIYPPRAPTPPPMPPKPPIDTSQYELNEDFGSF